ncbi:uncharacterized protein GGS25DRAFT_486275 [Hypoxylon fragiforme]|uniref:uncharacterized protein n=1 Tax=Hypoxylon fragiforme TaxID=63214 RepID=UPI0020C6C037|nr:uncharacterized protein GGS25DRAFT_486275 [Hypoxylon fragiforme]KAI2609790.1 hypothetical protein GGS25DRAFT_486275 [Hypoxylon fragiforme]
MRLSSYRYAAVCYIAVTTLTLADPIVNPLAYGNFEDFAPIHRRQLTCPTDYFSCEDRGPAFSGTCCENGQLCALDAQSQAACCPTTATCTGVAPTGATPTPSFVSNTYFQFPYIPTSFANSVACTSAVSQCSRNYQACVSGLADSSAGAAWGVTIVVPGGGGTTVAATQATGLPAATATSVCSSLSSEACYNLQSSQCTAAGTTGGFVIGTGNNAARPTAACVAGIVAGVGLGLMGGHI